MINIAAVTTTRADFGLLSSLLEKLRDDPNIDFNLIVTGTHLSTKHGHTVDEIIASGFCISEKIKMAMDDDTALPLTMAAGQLTQDIAQCFDRIKPDAVILLGDRFEILPLAFAAMMQGIKIIHLHGGEITLGAIDNKIRFAVSNLADLHLTVTAQSAKLLIDGGADARHVVHVGAPGVEHALNLGTTSRTDITAATGIVFQEQNILFTLHPETVSSISVDEQIGNSLEALTQFPDVGKFISLPNADPGNSAITSALRDFAERHPNAHLTKNLGHVLYLSLLSEVDAVVGNSSSGIIEAPAFGTPTVNIGDRQKGREQAPSIIDCSFDVADIAKAITTALGNVETSNINNHPYYSENTCNVMLAAIKDYFELLSKGNA